MNSKSLALKNKHKGKDSSNLARESYAENKGTAAKAKGTI
jgi:hypothetical protein